MNNNKRIGLYQFLVNDFKGLANMVWWWDKKYIKKQWPEIYKAISCPSKDVPLLLGTHDKAIKLIIQWRLKNERI